MLSLIPRGQTQMQTSRRNAANRANARLSTGPRTEAGKNRSRQNALCHGLTGRMVLLPSEDKAAFLRFSKGIVDNLHPETPAELDLAQTIADSHWRLNRVLALESDLLAIGGSEKAATVDAANALRNYTQAFITLGIYEQRLQRAIDVALKQLRELQAERKRNSSARVHSHSPAAPTVNGFVYSNNEIEAQHLRRPRHRLATTAKKGSFDLDRYEIPHRLT